MIQFKASLALKISLVIALVCSILPARGAIYFVSPFGDDKNSGLTPELAWQTVQKVNETIFSAGDSILFQGGRSFQGPVKFDATDSGTPEAPVVVGTYELETGGRAIIEASEGRGIDVFNMSGLRIADLKIIGHGPDDNRQSGILLLSTEERGANHVEIDRVEIEGFGKHGISIGAWKTEAGYRNVRITHCSTHDNLRTGIFTWGPWGAGIYAHRDIYIGDSRAFNMKGGSGLTFSSVDGGIIERCVVYENGREYSGGAGIWAWDSNDILFQFNESYRNRTIGADGDGFDFDGGVTNSIMQYNYSHDNDAAGYLLAQYRHAPQAMENVVIRYNISENDCRKKPYGAIHVWNGDTKDRIKNIHIYQNTIYLTSTGQKKPNVVMRGLNASMQALGLIPFPEVPSAMAIISPTTNVSVCNNLFYTTDSGRLLAVIAGQDGLKFQNNAYWTSNNAFNVEWMGKEYRNMAEWLDAASDQERLDSKILAIFEDPMLTGPGEGGTLGEPDLLSTLECYKLKSESPLRGRGIDMQQTFGLDPGEKGFFGTPISEANPPAIGAHLLHKS